LLPCQIIRDQHGQERALAVQVAHDAHAALGRQGHNAVDHVQCLRNIRILFFNQQQAEILHIHSQRHVEAVIDHAARRRDQVHVDAVVFSLHQIFVAVQNLELEHARA
jgi:hypothetical protein